MLKTKTYVNQIVQNGAAFFTIAMVIHYLRPEEVVLWYVYTTLMGATIVFELGLSTQITRYYSQGLAGAKEISNNEPEYFKFRRPNKLICSEIAEYGKTVFRILSAVFIIASLAYLQMSYEKNYSYLNEELTRLYLFNAGISISAYVSIAYNYQSAIEIAIGNGEELIEYLVRSKIVIIICTILTLTADLGVEYVILSNLIGLVYYRLKVYVLYRRHKEPLIEKAYKSVLITNGKIFRNTIKQVQASAGNFLANRSSVLIAANNLDAKDAMFWGLLVQVTSAAIAVSQLPIQLNVRTLVRATKEDVKRYFKKAHQAYILLSIFVITIFVLLSNWSIIEGELLLLAIMLAIKWLELNHSNACMILSYRNNMRFYSASLFSGTAIAVCTFFLSSQNLFVYALIAFGVQLSYNNWKWPLVLKQVLK